MIKKLSIPLLIVATVVVMIGLFTLLSAPTLAAAQPPTTVQTASSPSYQLNWDVAGNGASMMQSASFTMYSTTGQAVTSPMSSSTFSLKNGFWSGVFEGIYKVFLPMITK